MERFAIKIDKTLRANLYKICRLCGIDNPDKVKVRDDANIVNLEDGEPELWKKVSDCIGLLITKDDKMPQFMCTLCVDKINDFFEFREMCYATDGQTRKLLGIKPEPKVKVLANVPSSSIDFKIEDIKEPIPEIIPQRASRKRRNADLDMSKEIKTDETEDVKPSTENIGPKKKRIKLSSTETETKPELGTKPGPSSRATGITAKKEPGTKPGPASKTTGIVAKKEIFTKVTPKSELTSKLGLSKKRLKTEIIIKENKKEAKPAKMTKLMKKKLKEEIPQMVVQEEQQPTKKKKLELLKQKKLPQPVVKSEKLKRGSLDTKIKEEESVTIPVPAPVASDVTKNKSKLKEKCRICDEGFVNKFHLDKHVKITHIPTVHRYHCVQCNETLKKNMEIKNHNLWHKLSKTPFKCGNCSELSCSIYTYSKHIRDCNQVAYLDSHIPDWHCPDCSDNYQTTFLFNIHSCISKKLVCPGCEKSLKWKEDYFKHIPTCTEAFHRIPPYMTSNIQVKNEADHPSSPIPPISTVPVPTSVTVQTTTSTRVTPPQMDSNQCVVIPGNISLLEEGAGSSSPSKSSRKGKRITKKDLKRFDKLLKSTMTTLVSIKHEPAQGGDTLVQEGTQPTSCEVREPNESPPESPMHCGGDDFHQNDDTDSADERTAKPVGTIKQEIIDEGYRDLFNNIEVNIKQEIEANKSSAEETSSVKKTLESIAPCEESTLALKPILKLKITKEHGTLNSVLMDSPVSEKKKKKKKRKEDRVKSPEKDEHSVIEEVLAPKARDYVDVPIPDITSPTNDVPVVAEKLHEEPAMPLPEIIEIKKEINETEVDEGREEASSIETTEASKDTSLHCTETEKDISIHCTPSIVAASSGSLQILCVSEGVTFHRSDQNEEQMPQEAAEHVSEQEKITSEESSGCIQPRTVVQPISSTELSIDPVSSIEPTSTSIDQSQYMQYPFAEQPYDEIDIKPRLEDLIPMLQIASVTSGAEVIDQPIKKIAKKKRRPTVAKHNSIPKIVSVSSVNVVSLYKPVADVPPEENQNPSEKVANYNENAFDFSQVKIKEEIVDHGYDEESSATVHQEEDVENEAEEEDELEEEVAEEGEVEEEEIYEDDVEEEDEEEVEAVPEEAEEEEEPIETTISIRQAEENAYIANIDFNNLTIKQEKEYIDDGLVNSAAFEEDEEEDESSDTDSEKSSSDDDDEESESEREYRDLPSDDEDKDTNDEDEEETRATHVTSIGEVNDKEAPATQSLGLQILTVRSEFSCSQSNEKTESGKMDSDEKLNLNTNTERPMDQDAINIDKNALAPMDQDVTNIDEYTSRPTKQDATNIAENTLRPMDQDATNIAENILRSMDQDASNTDENTLQLMDQGATNIDETICRKTIIKDNNEEVESSKSYGEDQVISMEVDNEHESLLETTVSDKKSTELTGGACITLEESCKNINFEMDCVKGLEQSSISQTNNVDHPVDKTEELSIQDAENRVESLKSSDDLINISTDSCVPNVKSSSDDLKSVVDEFVQNSQSPSNEERNLFDQLPIRSCPKEGCLKSSDDAASGVDHVESFGEPDSSCIDQISIPESIANAKELITVQSKSGTLQITNENEIRDVDMINIEQPSNSSTRSIDDVIKPGIAIDIIALGENETVVDDAQLNQMIPVSTSDVETLNATDVSTPGLTIYCRKQTEVPLPTLLYTDVSCQRRIELNLSDLLPVQDAEHNSSLIPIPVQSASSSQHGDTLNRGLNDFIDSQLRYREENQSNELPALLDNNLQSIPSNVPANRTADHTPNALEANNAFMKLQNSPATAISDGNTSYNHERQEYNVNLQIPSSALTNIPPYSIEMGQYNDAVSSYVTFNCNEPCSSNNSRFTEFHELNPPTAGQLQTSIVDQPVLTELTTNSLTNLPMLSEEVQNLLNEDTAATSNFDFNESVLRERSSAVAVDPRPNFNDFENLNEIAENNNNANIERELQDELGNVLAVAIADRSNDDEVDDNNVMNENRANFDIA